METIATDIIPETVADALKMWDAGETLFVVEMGGLGPGYEMAIQGLAFELMRIIDGFDKWNDEAALADLNRRADEVVSECDSKPWGGGFSGAQVGAAKNIASCVCRRGYRNALRDPAVKDRLIQVNRRDLRS